MAEPAVAVLVTHDRPELLLRCLHSLLAQTAPLRRIVLVDNASQPETAARLAAAGYMDDPRVEYHRLSVNVGSAGGFAFGMRRARELGEWIWVMDDDASAEPQALERLLAHTGEAGAVALTCKKVFPDGDTQWEHYGDFHRWRGCVPLAPTEALTRVGYAAFTGLMVRAAAAEAAGYPRADFFISYDDIEFCLRLRELGHIFFVPEAVVVHHERRIRRRGVYRRATARTELPQYWRVLCDFRNRQYVMRRYAAGGRPRSLLRLAVKMAKALIMEDHKRLRAGWILRYHRDSFRRVFTSLTPEQWATLVAAELGKASRTAV